MAKALGLCKGGEEGLFYGDVSRCFKNETPRGDAGRLWGVEEGEEMLEEVVHGVGFLEEGVMVEVRGEVWGVVAGGKEERERGALGEEGVKEGRLGWWREVEDGGDKGDGEIFEQEDGLFLFLDEVGEEVRAFEKDT